MSTQPRRFPFTASDPGLDPRDAALDDTIESSFPASDPPSSIPDPTFADRPETTTARGVAARFGDLFDTARLPKDAFLWAALGAMGASALLQAAGKKHASLFAGQWVPAFLLLGLYDKLIEPVGRQEP